MAGKTVGDNDKYSNEEAQRRFEAALRGAREVGHEPMKSLPKKRVKTRSKSMAPGKSEK